MSDYKLGFVQVVASEVVELAGARIFDIQAQKSTELEDNIQYEMKNVGFFAKLFGVKSYSREEAIRRLKDDDYNYWTWRVLQPDYVSPKHEKLQKLIQVGLAVQDGFNVMDLSVETASMLYK